MTFGNLKAAEALLRLMIFTFASGLIYCLARFEFAKSSELIDVSGKIKPVLFWIISENCLKFLNDEDR
jgi:hypothetical protein